LGKTVERRAAVHDSDIVIGSETQTIMGKVDAVTDGLSNGLILSSQWEEHNDRAGTGGGGNGHAPCVAKQHSGKPRGDGRVIGMILYPGLQLAGACAVNQCQAQPGALLRSFHKVARFFSASGPVNMPSRAARCRAASMGWLDASSITAIRRSRRWASLGVSGRGRLLTVERACSDCPCCHWANPASSCARCGA
jgi:hypothetical protein